MSVESEPGSKPPRPDSLAVEYETLPPGLTDRDTWIVWRYVWKADREAWAKIPINPHTGRRGDVTDADSWASFEEVREYHDDPDTDSDGLGFVFTGEDTIAGVDLDGCRDPDSGRPNDRAKAIINRLDSYTEVSPSGTGYHVYLEGELADDVKNRKDKIEIYDAKRFFTVTGSHVDGTPATVESREQSLREIHSQYVGAQAGASGRDSGSKSNPRSMSLSDKELLEKAKNAEYGDEFRDLWNGNTAGYESHSEADYALCQHLAFWTGGDQTRIENLFNQSDLTREKWHSREDYRERTIANADDSISHYYDPEQGNTSLPEAKGLPDEKSRTQLTTKSVRAYAGLGEDESIATLTDREKAAVVWELLKRSDDYHVRVRRENQELYACENGVWSPTGERALAHAARQALGGPHYGNNVLRELEAQAKGDPSVELPGEKFGLEPGMLAVENGLLDLEKVAAGEENALRSLDPTDYALTRLSVEYDPNADPTPWDQFVSEVVEGSKTESVQRFLGFVLDRGRVAHEKALLCVGSGANGKTTFLNTVVAMLGEENVESKGLTQLGDENHLAELEGSIANIDPDLSSGKLYSSHIGNFKKVTGGDMVTAQRKYKQPFNFHPTAKHLFAANTTPDVSDQIDDDDTAFWRRWILAEFPNYYPEGSDKRDPDLEERLQREENLSGMLNWCIEGWHRLNKSGSFADPDNMHERRSRWHTWGENLEEFVETCVEHDPDAPNLSTGDAYEIYTQWCRENDKDPESQHAFTTTLATQNVGYAKSVRPQGTGTPTNGYKALGFTDDAPELESVLGESAGSRGTGLDDYD